MINFHYNTLAAPSMVEMRKKSNSTSEMKILCFSLAPNPITAGRPRKGALFALAKK